MRRIPFIDSHTAGEPTRIILGDLPDLGTGSLAERCRRFRDEHDDYRRLVVNEPRGSDILVGGLLVEPHEPGCAAGVIFFNNVGVLNMCGHGTIGLMVTLAHLGRIGPGVHHIDTPAGVVTAHLHDRHRASITNVPSYRFAKSVPLDVPGYGRVTGDIAWGGNWFFLVSDHRERIERANVERLTEVSRLIRRELEARSITGADNAEIDHIELLGPPGSPENHGRNFVLCPGLAYDRSPCGTGTSAKLACLAADGKLRPGELWRQESVLGTVFEGRYEPIDATSIRPMITGSAFVTAEGNLIVDGCDELRSA